MKISKESDPIDPAGCFRVQGQVKLEQELQRTPLVPFVRRVRPEPSRLIV